MLKAFLKKLLIGVPVKGIPVDYSLTTYKTIMPYPGVTMEQWESGMWIKRL